MSRQLTKKQRQFINEYVKTGNGTKSALKVYNTKDENTGAVIATENLRKPKILKSISERLDDDLLLEKHLLLLNKIDKSTGDIETHAVSRGLELAYRVKGSFAPDKQINMNIDYKPSEEERERALKALKDL